ncbi:HAMP domain-containing protein, partial [bacterium]|nr:HAMP domain-containing protein [bacterium]
ITVIDLNGNVLADSEEDPKNMENHKLRNEVIMALSGKPGIELRFSATVQKQMLYVAIPIKIDQGITGVLRLSLFIKDIDDFLWEMKKQILLILIIVIIIALLASAFFSKSISMPISKLVSGANSISQGNFNVKVLLENKDELGELANSFNNMADKIKELFSEVNLKNEELNSIINSIKEGFLVLDKNGKILLYNESFKKLSNVSDLVIEKDFFWNIIRDVEFGDLIKELLDNNQNCIKEVDLFDKRILCSVTFLSNREELVILLYDLTETYEYKQRKRDFVSNISHELRTPLTAIKGFVETMEDEVNDQGKKYINIVKRNVDRLINIVEDLIVISKFDQNEVRLELEETKIDELIDSVILLFEHKAKEKDVKLNLKVKTKDTVVEIDRYRMEQVFVNLIDNALKYTDKGEVNILIDRKDGKLIIEIKDTGIGIPQNEISKIFERFYVVDKSRSRKLGGTGLGLSIVRKIIELHGGRIRVESEAGKGSSFFVEFFTL